MASETPKI